MQTQVNEPLTLGSLFDGSGGFPLGGLLSGIQPVWASEIEPVDIIIRLALPGYERGRKTGGFGRLPLQSFL